MHDRIIKNYLTIRQQTEAICQPLEIEDYVIQGMDDVSPAKWHLAHTTWFFETFILIPSVKNYRVYRPEFVSLFNSYYQSLNQPYLRSARGLLSRPTVAVIYDYRHYVDKHMQTYLSHLSIDQDDTLKLLAIGLAHEQQHQELLLMDIKYNYSLHYPDVPIYQKSLAISSQPPSLNAQSSLEEYFISVEGGIASVGFAGEGFSFDNEHPVHRTLLTPYRIANRLVTNEDYLMFINAGGYQNPAYWLSDGWDCIQKNQWKAPLYWYHFQDQWHQLSLKGLTPLVLNQPICHVSYYEADAYARWRGKRLPTEMEWEHFVSCSQFCLQESNFLESNILHPLPTTDLSNAPQQFFGDVWEWTMSAYVPYPGYNAYAGSLGEYNGKFMCNQMVLRGGSCVTPRDHIRASYRNFFQADKRWQFAGFRLAEDIY